MTDVKKPLPIKKIVAGVIFAILAFALSTVTPSIEVAWVTGVLVLTIYLFAFEVVDVDVAAICIMVILGLTTLFAPYMGLAEGLVDTQQIFNGFANTLKPPNKFHKCSTYKTFTYHLSQYLKGN